MRVSLAKTVDPAIAGMALAIEARPLLDPAGPFAILGHRAASGMLAQPIVPAADTLFGPRGAAMASAKGPLVVADTGHHRLLIWTDAPTDDQCPADFIIGQRDFSSEGRNGKAAPGPATLNVPTGVAIAGSVLAVADAWNHRVLIWTSLPKTNNQPADVVLGQPDFSHVQANRGRDTAHANTLNWCYGVALIDGKLFVADTGNRRVLVWDDLPRENGQPADRVLGQNDFTCRDENAGANAGPLGMRWPHGIARMKSSILVSDAGNNRIMVWQDLPERPGVPCNFVLGQKDMASSEHNRGHYLPGASALNMPYALATCERWLLAADTANSRLIGWNLDDVAHDAPASALSGQPNFHAKGDNRWQAAARDSVCWPYGISACDDMLIVADSGNNRILLWRLA